MPKRKARPDNAALRRALLAWFARHARPLPWRKTHSAYKVWVSEIMLQQTQVPAVVPYYRRFLRAFPSAKRLAGAPLERVLELWSGLGYYRRARRLRQAAQILARDFAGHFPRDYRRARSLPGVGDYTARAVLSMAYGLPYAVLDGNVARVVARLRALRGHLNQHCFRRAAERTLDGLLAKRQPGNFNQAMMELGQTVCLPRAPRCPTCPIRRWCAAYGEGTPESYPAPRPRRPREVLYLAAAVIRRGGKFALVRGLDEGLLSDLWNFPAAFGRSRPDALACWRNLWARRLGGNVRIGRRVAVVRHGITHRAIHVDVYPVKISKAAGKNLLRWFPLVHLPQAAVSQLARKIAAKLQGG